MLAFVMSLCVIASASAQGSHPVGSRTVSWLNTSSFGSTLLAATVKYPAVAAGTGTAVLPSLSGWPVIVFLHGYSFLGVDYSDLGSAWASAGYVVVLGDTAQFDWVLQEHDGRAMFGAVGAANVETGGPFEGALDTSRVVLAGHSMGGAGVAHVLQNNPGYRGGFALAPVMPLGGAAAAVSVPLAIAVGMGDTITPWDWYSQPYYNSVTQYGSLKFFYLMDANCDHMALAGLSGPTAPQFTRVVSLGLGFFGHVLGIDPTALENVFGRDPMQDPQLVAMQRETAVPQLWLERPLSIGMATRSSQVMDPGIAGLVAATSLAPPLATPFGTLLLDPGTAFVLAVGITDAEGRIDIDVTLPPDPLLIGLPVALQGLGPAQGAELVLGSALFTHVRQ